MKGLFGCFMVLALLAVGVAVGGYFFAFKPLQAVAADWGEAVDDFREVTALEGRIDNTEPFAAPDDGLLTDEDVERFVAVQQTIAETAAEEREALETKYEELRLATEDGLDTDKMGPREFVMAVRDFADALRAAKEAQIEAMNAADFSIDEYRWVQRETLAAMGVRVMPADVTRLTDIRLEDIGEVGSIDDLRELGGEVREAVKAPEENVELVEPYVEHKQDWTRLAVLGL